MTKPAVSEFHDLESKWRASGDFGYLVLAIGKWRDRLDYPKYQPEWALEACREAYETSRYQMEAVVRPRPGRRPKPEYRAYIAAAAKLRYEGDKRRIGTIFRDLITAKHGLSPAAIEEMIRSLRNYWGADSFDEEGVACNRHVLWHARQETRRRGYGADLPPP